MDVGLEEDFSGVVDGGAGRGGLVGQGGSMNSLSECRGRIGRTEGIPG